ncbi:MAG: hypothetical protein CMJ78_05515 [Planctomycetaceae bacterium]|nr:hypothetical protein [Planctomycetaceae bacterium]
MGTWGPGLYSNDIAKDLKATISAVVKLPFEGDRLVEIISEAFPHAANDETDEDYTTFWLVMADQLHRKGVAGSDVLRRAIAIIDSDKDLNSPAILEMAENNQKKRKKALDDLRTKISKPVPDKKRKTLAKAQPLLMDTGDVIAFPIVETGGCFNPYFTKAKWECADWGAAVIIDCGLVFGYLAQYTPVVINRRLNVSEMPTLDQLADVGWKLTRPGTCSNPHYKRMEIAKIGSVTIDQARIETHFPNRRDGTYAAVNDISIANSFHVAEEPREREVNIDSLSVIAKS